MTVMNTPQLVKALDELGFKPEGDEHRCNGLKARIESRWVTFQAPVAGEGDLASDTACTPGLWKDVRGPDGELARVFDLPLLAVTEQEAWDEETGGPLCPLAALVQWVGVTQSGSLPAGWKCPPPEEIEAFLPAGALTFEVGPVARQGKLHCEHDRLAVSVPLLSRVPADLTPQRRARLDELLADAQDRHRMVRITELETGEEGRSVLAEVDLSGAPLFAVPLLLRIGLDGVRHVVSQTLSVVELLVDPAVTSTVWDIPLVQERPAEGSQK